MKKTVVIFGLLILSLLLLFHFSKYALISNNLQIELVIALIAIVFFIVGIYINKRSLNVIKNTSENINHQKIEELELSTREYEVLQYISDGLSNKEIADKLFLSESTIKTHVSSLLLKLNAKRRTQAVQIANSLQII